MAKTENIRNRKEYQDYWHGYSKDDFNEPICNKCIHKNINQVNCKAYPEGIPIEILDNTVNHKKKYINDNGIQFKPID